MASNDFKYPVGQRVRLKHDRADVYRRAFGGSEGIVRSRKFDETGHYPMIYIDWDVNHWMYNGEDDLWTFESHFEPVERVAMADDTDKLITGLMGFLENFQQARGQEDAPSESGSEVELEHDPENPHTLCDHGKNYDKILSQATDFAKNAESFILVAVTRTEHPMLPGETVLVPEIFTDFKTDDAALLMDSQLSQVAASAHTEAAGILISRIYHEREEEERRGPSN